jgi:hypothetical protein
LGYQDIKPNNTIQCRYSNLKTLDERKKADAILCHMTKMYLEGSKPVKPNSITYLAAIKAWMALAAAGNPEDKAAIHIRF